MSHQRLGESSKKARHARLISCIALVFLNRRLGVQLKLSTSMLKRTPSSSQVKATLSAVVMHHQLALQVHAEQQTTHELSNPKVVESSVLPVHAPLYQGERLPLTSLSQHEQQSSQRMVRPGAPPQHLGLQMRAGQHYGMQPQQQQGKDNIDHYSNHFFAEVNISQSSPAQESVDA